VSVILQFCVEVRQMLIDIHRPLIVIGGSSEHSQEAMGAFQEHPQV